ncbi:glycosyltransferase [Oceanobacillus sp. J11TS1]|uniref:glycosyltransferase n=1 Tax=Oceanobacillus sp. J11TS1 TaxID=2807191 RepID=UPI001B1E9581|nr:glycosyltransferase [Oceanobacillus sp. J11TS1]GIO23427.1 hypothetical protein J11TS1_20080 [Oceanobacillus sp. J11TS1]
MNKRNNNIQELIEKKKNRNAELEAIILQKKELLHQKEIQYKQSKQRLDRIRTQFIKVKQGNTANVARSLRRVLKRNAAYLTGRRNRRELFDKSIKRKKAAVKIKKVKYSLYELGFRKKALVDLEQILRTTDNGYLKNLAAWELALWHANKYTKDGARNALHYLSLATKKEKRVDFLRKAAIMKAECLQILDDTEQGKYVIANMLKKQEHVDLYLAAANLETRLENKIAWINKAFSLNRMSSIELNLDSNVSLYDALRTKSIKKCTQKMPQMPKVSIIIPVYNAEYTIKTAMDSILTQTWSNIEVLVVDDCSTDNTVNVVNEYVRKDSRVQLLTTEMNSGPYVARNIALQIAKGDFVTINDADDWSHAEKIEVQVKHLLENERLVANTSQQARLTEDLNFYRRGKAGQYTFANMSSLMFRRKIVMEKLGYWDCVRFGADGEFKKRLKEVFGDSAVVDLQNGPYSFQRQSNSSLTGNSVFGYHGYFMGVRKEYADSYQHYHKVAKDLYYPFPIEKRLFPVPEPMWPIREKETSENKHFDVIIASEFRLLGGTNMSNIEEIKAQKMLGLRTGLIQMSRYDFHSEKQMNPKVRELIDGDQVRMLNFGEKVTCDVLIVRHPPVLQEWQKYLPEIAAHKVCVIINQPPKREYSKNGQVLYDIKRCANHLKKYIGKSGTWYPIGPRIRETLLKHHVQDLQSIKLANEDWMNIINVNEWKRPYYKRTDKIKIGRHSRDQYVKWPNDKEQLLTIYPDSPEYEIHILGGAKSPQKVLGTLPANWHVKEFGEVPPKDFLANLDVFVYYTHPNWVEAFGRVIFEAMATGVPVILPPSYKQLFGEAALYAAPNEVIEKIHYLMQDEKIYQLQVTRAFQYIEQHFGYAKHARRLEDCFVSKLVEGT